MDYEGMIKALKDLDPVANADVGEHCVFRLIRHGGFKKIKL
jgi:hypothetical protein